MPALLRAFSLYKFSVSKFKNDLDENLLERSTDPRYFEPTVIAH